MKQQAPILIPSSIQRVRCFMNADGRFKVKPWAGVEETLDVFSALLTHQSNDDAFWDKLHVLVDEIAKDLRARLAARGTAVENEVLDSEHYVDLLHEIRRAASHTDTGKGAFNACLKKLSGPAVSLMFLLGSVVTIGCTESTDATPDGGDHSPGITSTDSTSGADSNSDSLHDTDIDSDTDTESDVDTDTGSDVDTGTESDVDTGTESDVDTGTESDIDTMSDSGTNTGTDDGFQTLEEIVREVITDESTQEEIMVCIDGLHESWHDGLQTLFQQESDSEIQSQLDCLLNGYRIDMCNDPKAAGEYDVEMLLNNCAVLLYLGVRFE